MRVYYASLSTSTAPSEGLQRRQPKREGMPARRVGVEEEEEELPEVVLLLEEGEGGAEVEEGVGEDRESSIRGVDGRSDDWPLLQDAEWGNRNTNYMVAISDDMCMQAAALTWGR